MVDNIDEWWNPDFFFTKAPHSIRLEAKPGGQFVETAEDGSFLVWGSVVAVQPGQSITLAGPFAPPYAGPGYTTLHLSLEEMEDGHSTKFQMLESVFGYIGENLKSSMASGWQLLFGEGLKPFAEEQSQSEA